MYDAAGKPVDRSVHISELSADMAELGNYRHFMQKEIHEQPRALTDTLLIAVAQDHIQPEWFGFDAAEVLGKVNAVTFLACGTSYHAAKVATYWLEEIAGIPAHAEIASEYRYRTTVPNPDALDRHHLAVRRNRRHPGGAQPCQGAGPGQDADHLQRAGVGAHPRLAPQVPDPRRPRNRRRLDQGLHHPAGRPVPADAGAGQAARPADAAEQETAHLAELRSLPNKVQQVLALEPQVEAWSQRFANKHHALFLGRGVHYPIALEGALKLKEISYIHAEAYPAGELKHGPLALVDEDMPVVTIAPNDQLIEKLKSNLQEVRARGGELYVFADGDVHIEESAFVHVIKLPGGNNGALSPILHTIPLQMLSYHAALQKGTDVDKPRNLAKSVTVE